jgi:hypothetical protein
MKWMARLGQGALLLLGAWFTLDLIGIPGWVTRDELVSPAGLLEGLLLLLAAGYLLRWKITDGLALLVLAAWGYLQLQAHWQYFLFGAALDRVARYNQFYAGMARFAGPSSTRLIPDAYHTVLAGLIVLNILLIGVKLAWRRWGRKV